MTHGVVLESRLDSLEAKLGEVQMSQGLQGSFNAVVQPLQEKLVDLQTQNLALDAELEDMQSWGETIKSLTLNTSFVSLALNTSFGLDQSCEVCGFQN